MALQDVGSEEPIRISAALAALCPHIAEDVARLFPFPHLAFFRLPAARMHLLGLAYAGRYETPLFRYLANAKRWRDAVTLLADPAPLGLEGILSKLTLPMWSPTDYRLLWDLLGCPDAKIFLLHEPSIEPVIIEVMKELPAKLRCASVVRFLRRPLEARVLAMGFQDAALAARLGKAAGKVKTRHAFYLTAQNMIAATSRFEAAPDIGHPNIKAVRTGQELQQVALRFRNCLRDYVKRVSSGEAAFYVYDGAEPAVVMVVPRVGGVYRIERMLGQNNVAVSDATTKLIRDAFDLAGVGNRQDEHQRNLLDYCITQLRLTSTDVAGEIDRHCQAFFEKMEKGENEDDFWMFPL